MFRSLGDVVVKGKTKPVAIFEVVGRAAPDTIGQSSDGSSAEFQRGSCMKKTVLVLAVLAICSPASAQLGGLGGAMKRVQQAQDTKKKIDDLTFTDEEEQTIGARCQYEGASALRRGPGPGGAQVRDACRDDTGQGVGSARPAVDLHRAGHGRRQRIRLSGRLRARHAWSAWPDQERGGTGRCARPRDRSCRPEAHDQRATEERGREAGHQCGVRSLRVPLDRRQCVSTTTSSRTPTIAATNSMRIGSASNCRRRPATPVRRSGRSCSGWTIATRIRRKRTVCSHRIPKPRSGSTRSRRSPRRGRPTRRWRRRYASNVKYEPSPITAVAVVADGASGLTGSSKSDDKKEEPKKKGFGLGSLKQTVAPEKQSAQVSASGGARGVGSRPRGQRWQQPEHREDLRDGGRTRGVQDGDCLSRKSQVASRQSSVVSRKPWPGELVHTGSPFVFPCRWGRSSRSRCAISPLSIRPISS